MEPVKYKKKLEIRDHTYKYLENTFADKTTGIITVVAVLIMVGREFDLFLAK